MTWSQNLMRLPLGTHARYSYIPFLRRGRGIRGHEYKRAANQLDVLVLRHALRTHTHTQLLSYRKSHPSCVHQ